MSGRHRYTATRAEIRAELDKTGKALLLSVRTNLRLTAAIRLAEVRVRELDAALTARDTELVEAREEITRLRSLLDQHGPARAPAGSEDDTVTTPIPLWTATPGGVGGAA